MDELMQMLETLKVSVVGIATSGADNRDELLEKSFTEFGAALEPVLAKFEDDSAALGAEELAKSAPEGTFDEPLYKGLGCVGRVADFVSMMARQVATIKTGKDRYQAEGEDVDPASEEVADLLDHAVALGELALRAAVNEHVDVAMDGDEADEDLNFVKLANAEDPDNAEAGMLVKSYLPLELARFAIDPGSLDMQIVQRATTLMLEGGVSEEHLVKVFELEDLELLNKDGDVIPGGGQDPAADGSQQPDMGDGQADPNDPVAQLEIAGRIMAAGMMQIEHCMQLLEGGSAGAIDPSGVDPNADAGADAPPPGADEGAEAPGADAGADAPGADEGADAPPPAEKKDEKKKDEVAKSADGSEHIEAMAKMQEQLADLRSQRDALAKSGSDAVRVIETLTKRPAPAKGVVMAASLTKGEDALGGLGGGAEDDQLTKLAQEYARAPTDDRKQQVLFKASFKGIKGKDILAKLA